MQLYKLFFHNRSYGENAFPDIPVGRSMPPSHFQPIEWLKCKEVYKQLVNEYDRCFKHWKQSGFHGEIPTDVKDMTQVAAVPFADFSSNNSTILYMHEFIFQFPNILEKVSGNYMKCFVILYHELTNVFF